MATTTLSKGQITITDFTDPPILVLSPSSILIPSESDGSYTGSYSATVTVYVGGSISTDWTFTKTDGTGITSTFNPITQTVTIAEDALTVDSSYIDIVASRADFDDLTVRLPVVKILRGIDGVVGMNGVAAYLTNPTHDLLANKDGVVYPGEYAGASTAFVIFEGGTDSSSTWTFTLGTPTSGLTVTKTNNVISVTGLTADSGYVDITASKTGYTDIVLRFSVTRISEAADGVSPRIVNLTADYQAVNYDKDGNNPSPSGTIVLTAKSQNTIGTMYYRFTVDSVLIGSVVVSSTGTATANYNIPTTYFNTPKSVKVEMSDTNFGTVVDDDTLAIVATRIGQTGSAALYLELTNDTHVIPANSLGEPSTYIGAETTASLYLGGVDDSSNWTIDSTASAGITYTKSNNNRTATITAVTTAFESGYIDFTATRAGYATQTIRFSVTKAKGGANAVVSNLSNDSHPLPSDKDGVVSSFTGATTTMYVYVGGTDDSTNWTYTTSASSGITYTGANTRVVAVTAMSVDSGYIDITATKSGYSNQVQRFSIVKQKQGNTGTNAFGLSIYATSYIFREDKSGAVQPDYITIKANKQNITTAVAWTTTVTLRSTTDPASAVTTTGDTVYLHKADFGSNTTIDITGTSSSYSDTITVTRVREGSDSVYASNSNSVHQVSAYADGTVKSYVGSGTTLSVLEGGSALVWVSAATTLVNGTYKVTSTTINPAGAITVPSITSATVGDLSAMAAATNTVTITYNISYKTYTGVTGTITTVQTIDKKLDTPSVEISATNSSFAYNALGTTPSPSSSVITANAIGVSATPYYEFYVGDTLAQSKSTTVTYNYSPNASYSNMPQTVTVKVYPTAGSAVVLAQASIGMNATRTGDTGATGTSALNLTYTNDSLVVQQTAAGVSTWTGSGGTLQVYEGATALTLSSNTQSTTTPSTSGQYVLDITKLSGDTLTEPAITGQNTTTTTIADWAGTLTTITVYRITAYIKRTNGTNSTISVDVSISPAKSGANGNDATSYWLATSTPAVQKSISGVYTPASITYNIKSATGTASPVNYAGRFIIATSTDGNTYTDQYTSSTNESSYTYTIPAGIKTIRVRAYLAGGTTTLLDELITTIVSDGATGTAETLPTTVELSTDYQFISYDAAGAPTPSGTLNLTARAYNTNGIVWNRFTVDGVVQGSIIPGSNDFAFIYETSGSTSPLNSSTVITLRAGFENTTGTATWSATAYNSSGSSIGSVSLTGTAANIRTLTAAQFGANGTTTAYVIVTATSGTLSDSIMLYRHNLDETLASTPKAFLTNHTYTVPADAGGTVVSYEGASGIMKVFIGQLRLTNITNPKVVFSLIGYTGFSTTYPTAQPGIIINPDTGAYAVTGNLTGAAGGTITIRATIDGSLTVDRIFNIRKSSAASSQPILTLTHDAPIIGSYSIPSSYFSGTKTIKVELSRSYVSATFGAVIADSTVSLSATKVGSTGQSNYRIYIAGSPTSTPATPSNTINGATPAGWSATPISGLTEGQAQYQSDGTMASGTDVTTWSTPYLSYFKVGSLSAITATIGLLRTTTSGQRVEITDNVIRVYDSSNTIRVKIGNLA